MKTMYFLVTIITFFIFSICQEITAQDWPQFLGPERNSTSPQTGLLRSWPEGGPEVLWSVNVGIGYGGPVVKDGKVYLLDRDDEVGDIMRCFNLQTGEELWKFSYDAPGTVSFPGSRSVPVVDNRHVYTCGPNGDLCMNMNGEIMWKTKRNPNFDRGSMILADGLILVTDGLKTLYLIEPDPTAFKSISKATLLGEGGASTEGMSRVGGNTQNWAPLALADGKLLY